MRLIIQRVRYASVEVDQGSVGEIADGLLVLAGTTHSDTERDAEVLAAKLVGLRIFADAEGKMNRSLIDIGGEVLLVSQFTVYGSVRKGQRPSFADAGDPVVANRLIQHLGEQVAAHGIRVATGEFGASMLVTLQNTGPVTLIVETEDGRVI